MTLEFKQDIAAIAKCLGKIGLDCQRPVKAGERLLIALEVELGIAAIAQGLDKVGQDRQRPVIAG